MQRVIDGVLLSVLVIALLASSAFAADQPPTMIPPGPVPAQMMTAKKIFIANLLGNNFSNAPRSGRPDGAYSVFYFAMQNWGRYEVVSSPAAADLVFELRFLQEPKQANDITSYLTLELNIVDPATRMPLWAMQESYFPSDSESQRALAALITDVKTLDQNAALQAMNDARIATIMASIAQSDIDFAKVALGKSKNKDLRQFAQQVIDDHTALQKSIQEISQKSGLKTDESMISHWLYLQSSKVHEKLVASGGKSFDKYYAADEIQFHQMMSNALTSSLLPQAQDPGLKAALANAQSSILAELANAQKLSALVDPQPKDQAENQ